MCKVGDIIVVKNYKQNGIDFKTHSFIVLNIDGGQIEGLDYDIICNVMSSFRNKDKLKKLSFSGNLELLPEDREMISGNDESGYVKAEQLFYFDKSKLDYYVIGNLTPEAFRKLIDFIQALDAIEHIVDNL
jgi:hypothetical protein